jgi:hypothetical protein
VLDTHTGLGYTAIEAARTAGHVYSRDFYQELYRVLRRRGRIFHYIGNPDSPFGRSVTQGVVRQLKEASFTHVEPAPRAFGVMASK